MKHPGLLLQTELSNNGMSRKELAIRTGVTEKHISTVINGDRGISAGFARKLGYVFHDTAYWLDAQSKYDDEQLRIKEENNISAEEINILKNLHEIIAHCIACGFIHNNCGDASKIMQLRALFNVSDLTVIPKITYNAAYRAQLSTNIKVDPYVLFAWQRLCEKETENISISKKLDKQLLKKQLPQIKSLMFGDINQGIEDLQIIFAECGIAFQVVKNFRGAPVQGFIKELNNSRIILCVTIRRQRADIFWFTLFHEIAHILNNDYSARFVDFTSIFDEIESRADTFASNTLLNPEDYHKFISTYECTSWDSIERFAHKMHVQPFIVLGRLQKDEILDWSDYSEKIVKYSWA